MRPFITVVFVITLAFFADLFFNSGKYSIETGIAAANLLHFFR